MPLDLVILLLGLSGLVFAADRQHGVEYTGLGVQQNEEIQMKCGKEVSRMPKKIFGGQNVTSEEVHREIQWMVRVLPEKGVCSGILISRYHVLTAAHCQIPLDNECTCDYTTYDHKQKFLSTNVSTYKVRVYTRFGHKNDVNAGRTYEVKRIIFPASYTSGDGVSMPCKSHNNDTEDIAIYELKEPVAFPTFACLANVDLPFKTLTNYGFGITGLNNITDELFILKKHDVHYVDCKTIHLDAPNGRRCERHATSDVTLACGGDSGGPIVSKYYDRIFTVGVLTAGPSCIRIRKALERGEKHVIADQITSVPYYKNWICKWSGICVYGADPTKDKRPTTIWEHTGEKAVKYA